MTIILQILAMMFLHPSDGEVCTGTQFAAEGDKWLGGDSPWLRRPIKPTDNGVAHRTFPLGAKVVITNLGNGRKTVSKVIDRGPFGRYKKDGSFKNGVEVFRKARRECLSEHIWPCPITTEGWRGCLDMTPLVTKRLGMKGNTLIHVELKDKNT